MLIPEMPMVETLFGGLLVAALLFFISRRLGLSSFWAGLLCTLPVYLIPRRPPITMLLIIPNLNPIALYPIDQVQIDVPVNLTQDNVTLFE